MAGVIKMIMAMRHETLPATLHVNEPSPHVDWTAGAVSLLTESHPWPAHDGSRRAGISSFGISGTNAHVIVEQAPAPAATPIEKSTAPTVPWVLSAKSAAALRGQASRLSTHLQSHPALDARDVAWTLAGRATFEHRAVVLGADRTQLEQGLAELAADEPGLRVTSGHAKPAGKTVFVFPGQGSQWLGMGIELLDASPVFAEHLQACSDALAEFVDWSLIDVLRGASGGRSEATRESKAVHPDWTASTSCSPRSSR